MTKKPRIEVYSERAGGILKLGFRVRSKNGRTIVEAGGFNTFQGAQKSITALTEIMTGKVTIVDLRETLKRGRKAKKHAEGNGFKSISRSGRRNMTLRSRRRAGALSSSFS